MSRGERNKSNKIRLSAVAVCLAIFLGGCGAETNLCSQFNNPDGQITDGLLVSFETDKTAYAPGENVHLSLDQGYESKRKVTTLNGLLLLYALSSMPYVTTFRTSFTRKVLTTSFSRIFLTA